MTDLSLPPAPQLTTPSPGFGIAAGSRSKLARLFSAVTALQRVWIFGSRATGAERAESDIDLAIDAPDMDAAARAAFAESVRRLGLLYRVDIVFLQDPLAPEFRRRIEQDRRVFWEPVRAVAPAHAGGGLSLKGFQSTVVETLAAYVAELRRQRERSEQQARALGAMEGVEDTLHDLADYPRRTWLALQRSGSLPPAYASRPHNSRWDGAGRAIPNVCLKVPTGGGKTLMAAAGVGQVMQGWLRRHTGLVLWVVPNEAIYRQTLAVLANRDHPCRQLLTVAGAGRVKVLEKTSPLTRIDVESHLCVMVLMLQSAARQSKETLRFFRDRGSVLGFLPREDDIDGHWALLQEVPNLDAYNALGGTVAGQQAVRGAIVKSSLGNVMRLLRPLVVIDEGHHAYSETALATLDGFNPSFMLELSATPRTVSTGPARKGAAGVPGGGSNILVDVRGRDLEAAEMIKLPINVEVRQWPDWQSCLAAAVQRLDALQTEALTLQAETARYIRPILLVQVERTGADTREAGFIHAEDARRHLLQLGFAERQIATKTSERNDLAAPENIDLLSPQCEVRAIITKQALQEGWDCPFAYVLCALAAGRNTQAMTQLLGRILRQPDTVKTGRAALDACHVLCHDAKTAEVVGAVKKALEGEGMGDLGHAVRASGDAQEDAAAAQGIVLRRREPWRGVGLFLPRVCWRDAPTGVRRDLVYESDVLAHVDWASLRPTALAAHWAPAGMSERPQGTRFALDLAILDRAGGVAGLETVAAAQALDAAYLVRAVVDIVPNPWWAYGWIAAVLQRLVQAGLAEDAIAASRDSLVETLRMDLQAECDRLAQETFERLLAEGRIEFSLRADAIDHALPHDLALEPGAAVDPLVRSDGQLAAKSLLEPALRLGLNEFEVRMASYLDQKSALRWWHRNVARAGYGLQGWRRHRVYPDFVFAIDTRQGLTRVVLLETKGLQLAGSADTQYKAALMKRLNEAYADHRLGRAGELALVGGGQELVCDLVFEAGWQGLLDARHFT